MRGKGSGFLGPLALVMMLPVAIFVGLYVVPFVIIAVLVIARFSPWMRREVTHFVAVLPEEIRRGRAMERERNVTMARRYR